MENISKIVLSQESGRQIGYVLDVALDENLNKIGFYVVDEETESEFLLLFENIVAIGNEFLLVKNESVLEFSANRVESPLGKFVIDEKGNNFGAVKSLVFYRKKCQKIVTDRCEILAKYLQNVGHDAIFISFKRKKSQKIEHIFPRFESSEIVQIQNVTTPEKISLSPNFYIGKVSNMDIFGFNNEKIIGKNEVITRIVVEKAKRHNKLNQLFFAIKR